MHDGCARGLSTAIGRWVFKRGKPVLLSDLSERRRRNSSRETPRAGNQNSVTAYNNCRRGNSLRVLQLPVTDVRRAGHAMTPPPSYSSFL